VVAQKQTNHVVGNTGGNMKTIKSMALVTALSIAAPLAAWAQTPGPSPATTPPAPPPAYGVPLSLEAAKKAMAAAEAEAKKNNWPVAIAILDTTGTLVMFQKQENTQNASVGIAIGKAKTALDFRRPSKALQDGIAAGGVGLRILGVPGAMPLEGGVMIVADGKLVGSIGVSGVLSEQDAQVAMAGAAAAVAK
jgi:glc operon protein GlcG